MSRPRLGEFLLQQGRITSEELEEALESQVVHGGRLGTNLVELGLLSEQELARALGTLHQVAFASGEMTPDPRALRLLDERFQDDRDVLVMRVDATRVSIACLDPHDLRTLDEIGFRTGKRVVPVVVPEFRLNQLLRRHVSAFRTVRAIDLDGVRPSRVKADATASAPAADLMSEDEFQSLYAEVLSGGRTRNQEELLEAVIVDDEATPPPAQPAAPMATPAQSFADAQRALAQSVDREQIAQTILRFATGRWKRALLLNVQGALVTGWHGAGEGIREAAVRRIAVALRGGSTFELVRKTRSHFVGPVKRDAGAAVFFRLLGGEHPSTAVILPLLVHGRVVHLLYVDEGPGRTTAPEIAELLILSQSVARSYDQLINARKARRT